LFNTPILVTPRTWCKNKTNKLLQNLGSITSSMRGTLVYRKHTLAKSSLESIQGSVFGSIFIVSIFNMNARCPIRPHMAIKPKIEVSAGGKAFICLSI
jgi:hypothetical protein